MLSRPGRKRRPSPREDGGISGVSSSCGTRGGFLPRHDEDLREPLMRRQGSHVSMHVARRSASFFSSCGGILEFRRGSQPSPWVGPGQPKLPLGLRGKPGGCARVTAVPKRPPLVVCPGPNAPLQGGQGSRGSIPCSHGESGLASWGSKGLRSPPESRRGYLGAP